MTRVVFLFALLSLVFAALFVADVQGYFNVAQRPVAFLKAGDGTIRRLGKNQLTWDRAQGGTLFGSGDTISTGEDSKAKLVFYAGGELELEAGSMVELGDDLAQLKLNFLMGGGRVRVAKKAEAKIQVTRVAANLAPKPKPASAKTLAVSTARTPAGATPASAPVATPSAAGGVEAPPPEGMEVAEVAPSDVQVDVVDDIPVPPPPPKQDLSAQAQEEARPLTPAPAHAPVSATPAAGTTAPKASAVANAGPGSGPTAAAGASSRPSPDSRVANASPGAAPSATTEPAQPGADSASPSSLGLVAPAIQEKSIRHPTQAFSAQGEIVSVTELPPVPEVQYPDNDAVINLGEGDVPKLQWQVPAPKEGGKPSKLTYEIVLRPAEGPGEEKVIKSDKPALSLSRLDRGKYLWSVRAVSANGKRGPSSPSRWLEVKLPAHMAKPVVLPVQVE